MKSWAVNHANNAKVKNQTRVSLRVAKSVIEKLNWPRFHGGGIGRAGRSGAGCGWSPVVRHRKYRSLPISGNRQSNCTPLCQSLQEKALALVATLTDTRDLSIKGCERKKFRSCCMSEVVGELVRQRALVLRVLVRFMVAGLGCCWGGYWG